MRETKFIAQNKDKWKSFEKTLEDKIQDPEKLSQMFIQITDDLSYARTFYPNRSVRVYLNSLAQRISNVIHKKTKHHQENKFILFWTKELPLIVYQSRTAFRIAFAIFLLSMVIGALSSEMDQTFTRTILGDNYVDMTLENIEKGDPMAVYKDKGMLGMALGITLNNIRVAFLTFILGVFSAIGSIAILVHNGIMVGSFQHLFYAEDVFWESFLTIWTHGTLEISAIIIAGAAGITMGHGLSFPGTLPRLKAFQISARRGLKIMVGLVPIFIAAGFIEGFFTRYTEISDSIQLLFILICLFFILFYFVWYPIIVGRRLDNQPTSAHFLLPDQSNKIDITALKTNSQIFTDTFSYIRIAYRPILRSAWLGANLYTIVCYFLTVEDPYRFFQFSISQVFGIFQLGQFFSYQTHPLIPVLQIGVMSIVYVYTLRQSPKMDNSIQEKQSLRDLLKSFIHYLISATLVVGLLSIHQTYSYFFALVILLPILMLCNIIAESEKISLLATVKRLTQILPNNLANLTGLYFITLLIAMMALMGIGSSIIFFQIEFILSNFTADSSVSSFWSETIFILLSQFFMYTILSFVHIVLTLSYHSMKEINDANHLKTALQNIGQHQTIQGMERESTN